MSFFLSLFFESLLNPTIIQEAVEKLPLRCPNSVMDFQAQSSEPPFQIRYMETACEHDFK